MATKKQPAAAQVQPIEHADPKAKPAAEHEHVEFTTRDAVLDVAYAAAELCDACAYLADNVSPAELSKVISDELTPREAFWLADALNKSIGSLINAKNDMVDAIL